MTGIPRGQPGRGLYKLRPDGSDYGFFETGTGAPSGIGVSAKAEMAICTASSPAGVRCSMERSFGTQLDGSGAEAPTRSRRRRIHRKASVRSNCCMQGTDSLLHHPPKGRCATIGTLTAFTPILMRFGPVALPPPIRRSPSP